MQYNLVHRQCRGYRGKGKEIAALEGGERSWGKGGGDKNNRWTKLYRVAGNRKKAREQKSL